MAVGPRRPPLFFASSTSIGPHHFHQVTDAFDVGGAGPTDWAATRGNDVFSEDVCRSWAHRGADIPDSGLGRSTSCVRRASLSKARQLYAIWVAIVPVNFIRVPSDLGNATVCARIIKDNGGAWGVSRTGQWAVIMRALEK